MKWNVLVSCPHLQSTIDKYYSLFEEHNIEIDLPKVEQNLSEGELLNIINKYDGVIAGDDKFTKKVLEKAEKLKVISKWGIGIDGIDLDAANKLGIKVYNTQNVFAEEVSDIVIGYIILLSRKLHIIDRIVREGKWKDAQLRGTSLNGKTLGIVGVGSIGQAVTRKAVSVGMNILGYDVYELPSQFTAEIGIKQVSFDELIKKSDFISLNCNLTFSNFHMINEKEFSMMKNGVYIINTARGPLINESALEKAIKEGKVGGVALDVFEYEPLPLNSSLRQLENCIFGAHNSSNTYEAVMRVNEFAIKNLIEGLVVGGKT